MCFEYQLWKNYGIFVETKNPVFLFKKQQIHTIIEYYTRLPLDFNPYRKNPLQSPLLSHAISGVWDELGTVIKKNFELIWDAWDGWDGAFQLSFIQE